jgi:transposase-like protein
LARLVFVLVSHPNGAAANQAISEIGSTFRTAYQNLNKVREVFHSSQDRTPLSGLVQIDGGHFCGKPRRPRRRTKMTTAIANNHLKNRKAAIVPGISASKLESWNREKLKKRRIILTLRQLGQNPGDGAVRTITAVVKAETAAQVLPVIRKYVRPGSLIHTDDGNAYTSLQQWYEHSSVRHSVEYCRDDGVNNNQAESFISRHRRGEYGVYRGMRPEYLAIYAAETAWLDDNRRRTLRQKFDAVLHAVLNAGISRAFRGYCQGHHLGFEYLG